MKNVLAADILMMGITTQLFAQGHSGAIVGTIVDDKGEPILMHSLLYL